jgi:serine/threonine-protein kinase
VAIDSADVERVTRALAFYIGPIAGIVVKRAIPQCSSIEDLYLKVAQEIDSRREREKFLQGHASIPRTSAPEADHEIAPVIRASKSPGSTGSPATISKSDEVETEAARPATEKPS